VKNALLVAALLVAGCVEQGIIDAAKSGNVRRVKEIIEASPQAMFEIDDHENTPAVLAILRGHKEVAVYLMEQGYPLGRTERTPFPLIMACLSRYTDDSQEMLRFLLEKGADPNENYPPEGWLPLTMAVNNGMASKARLLVQHGADLDRRNGDGQTALDVALDVLAMYEDPESDLPHGELSDPKVRAAAIKRWKRMVELIRSLKKASGVTSDADKP